MYSEREKRSKIFEQSLFNALFVYEEREESVIPSLVTYHQEQHTSKGILIVSPSLCCRDLTNLFLGKILRTQLHTRLHQL